MASSALKALRLAAAFGAARPWLRDRRRRLNLFKQPSKRSGGGLRRAVRYGFITWACLFTLWHANSYRTQDVPPSYFESDAGVSFVQTPVGLEYLPLQRPRQQAVVFFSGSGVAPHAYAPLLRPLAELGYPTFIVALPYRFAPFDAHKLEALQRAKAVIDAHPSVQRWVIAGHSLGGALAARFVADQRSLPLSLVLVGTTHPKEADLSDLRIPVTKVFATHDGIAPVEKVLANKPLLPATTAWVEIPGGNHSQFGNYGHQLLDGEATIGRDAQQRVVRDALLKALVD